MLSITHMDILVLLLLHLERNVFSGELELELVVWSERHCGDVLGYRVGIRRDRRELGIGLAEMTV